MLEHLGEHALWARLLASYDDGEWVALLIEDVEGRHPDFARRRRARGRARRDRPALRGPAGARRAGVGGPGRRGRSRSASGPTPSTRCAEAPAEAPVPGLAAQRPPRLGRRAARRTPTVPMPHVAHWDIRIDNLLRRPGGEIVFVDWGVAARGPAWADPLLARLERVDEPWFDDVRSPPPPPWSRRATTPSPRSSPASAPTSRSARSSRSTSTCPTLNEFRIRESRRMLDAVPRTAHRPHARQADLGARDACR